MTFFKRLANLDRSSIFKINFSTRANNSSNLLFTREEKDLLSQLLKKVKETTPPPLLDPLGWQYPSVKTLGLFSIYGLNLFVNSINLPGSSLPDAEIYKPLNTSTLYKNTIEACNAIHLYGLIANTLGTLALGIVYTLHANGNLYEKHGVAVIPINSKNLLYLPMLVNIGIEIALRIKNETKPSPKNINFLVACINISVLVLSAIVNSLKLSETHAIYGAASEKVFKNFQISLQARSRDELKKKFDTWKREYGAYVALSLIKNALENPPTNKESTSSSHAEVSLERVTGPEGPVETESSTVITINHPVNEVDEVDNHRTDRNSTREIREDVDNTNDENGNTFIKHDPITSPSSDTNDLSLTESVKKPENASGSSDDIKEDSTNPFE